MLYAHLYNSIEEEFFQDCIRRINESEELSLRRKGGQKVVAINVGSCMPWMDYTPRTLEEILRGWEAYQENRKIEQS